jgi:O-antigen ligase
MSKMSLSNQINESTSLRVWNFLFSGGKKYPLSDSWIGKLTAKLYVPNLSAALLLSALFLFWYEAPFSIYLPILTKSFVAPLLIILALLVAKKDAITIKKPLLWYMGFLIVGLFSGLVASFGGLSSTMLILGWVIYAIFGVLMLGAQAIENKELFLEISFWGLVPASVLGIFQNISQKGLVSVVDGAVSRAVGSFSNPNVFGMVLVAGILLGLWLSWQLKNLKYTLGVAPMVLALVLTGSRTAWIALFVGFFVAVWLVRPKWLKYTPLVFVFLIIPSVWSRLSKLFSAEYGYQASIDGRVWTLNNGIYIWQKNPILGTGPGSFGGKLSEFYQSPTALLGLQNGYRAIATTDNQWIEIIVQLGVLGMLSFLGFVASLYSHLWKSENPFRILVIPTFSAFLVMMLTSNALEFNSVAAPVAIIIGMGLSD